MKPAPQSSELLTLDTNRLEPVSISQRKSEATVSFESLRRANPRRSWVNLVFRWGIDAPVKLSPVAHVNFGDLAYSKTFNQKIDLTNALPDHDLVIKDILVQDPRITAKYTGTVPGPYVLDITFRPNPHRPPGPVNSVVWVWTNIANDAKRGDYYKIPVVVSGTVISDIVAIPGMHIEFSQFDFSKTKELVVMITDHDASRAAGFMLDGIKSNNGVDISKHFEVRFEDQGNRRTRVRLKYLGTFEGTWLRGELTLAKNDGGPSVVRLTFRGLNTKR